MYQYTVCATITGNQHVGVFEADSAEDALVTGWEQAGAQLCHQCADQIEDPEPVALYVENLDNPEDTAEECLSAPNDIWGTSYPTREAYAEALRKELLRVEAEGAGSSALASASAATASWIFGQVAKGGP